MIDKKAFYALSYGLYLCTAKRDGKDNGCIVDAVIQSASRPAHITIACMKGNLTREFISDTGEFNLSVLTEDTPQEFFAHFGMQSGRDVNKFESEEGMARTENGLLYASCANAVLSCRVIESQDLDSHVQFTAEVTEAMVLSGDPSITYAFYRQRVKKAATAPAAAAAPEPVVSVEKKEDAQNKGVNMTKWVCKVCGYVYEAEDDTLPEGFECPLCHASAEMFEKIEGEMKLAAEHEFGVYAKTVKDNPDISAEDKEWIFEQLKANFNGECSEVGMYLCMARVAHRAGYPEIGLYWEKAAFEEAEHAAKFAELLGEDLEPNMKSCTKCNLAWRVDCEFGATAGKFELAKKAKMLGLDAIHDTVHEMARDEARHGKALKGLLDRYFD